MHAGSFGRFSHSAENEPFYNETQTYNLPVVHPKSTKQEVVYKIDPEAGYLLTSGGPIFNSQVSG